MKVFLSSDMEGTAGVVDWEQCVGDGPQAAAGRRLRTIAAVTNRPQSRNQGSQR